MKPHVLRYWETQFSMLRPEKNRAGNRMYRPDEVKLLLRIKDLLYDRRYTIEGARRTLLDERQEESPQVELGLRPGRAPHGALRSEGGPARPGGAPSRATRRPRTRDERRPLSGASPRRGPKGRRGLRTPFDPVQ